ncbi:N-acetyltransferase 10 [Malassezia sp. CBS 17886]|nr:N-acetyltransferase 10 [Malassezia sp. CBS 17886]
MRKQLDPRIPTLIRNGVATGHRSFFVIVGDHARDQVVNLHFLLAQSRVEARPNVLWCYKKDLGFTTHRKKREAKIKRDIKRGVRDQDTQDPFELFVGVTDIRYCYYKDTPKILGRTFGMLVLQDFEAVTPNVLARTIETVEGGGIVVLLLQTMSSLRQLYSLSMDAHARFRTASSDEDPVARFNERFLLSLSANADCLLLDDELNVLPVSRGKAIRALPETAAGQSAGGVGSAVQKVDARRETEAQLRALCEDVAETKVVADVLRHAKTLDQARAVLTILDVLASKTLSTTVALTAGRGRGKSAALGLSLAAAIAHGYSNIFVTSPSPENLKTLFEFVLKGLDALGYEEVGDWDLQRGTGEWKDVVVRINVFRGHRQTIQYIQPQDHQVLSQAELVVIDEAAAIPLPVVRRLMGPYLVFLASTVHGYEGTGRALSLKLLQQLRGGGVDAARAFREVELATPIRYADGDRVEAWLAQLLCLDAALARVPRSDARAGCPHPDACTLYMVNRDTLFSYHPASELFLQRMVALCVASHYKNSPNDLQLMSDAPAHALFVLLPPAARDAGGVPEPLCVVQVALEGNISRQAILNSLARGTRDAGDLIPWLLTQQFQDAEFASLSGARIVRIAVHPEYAGMGYGSRALQQLEAFYRGALLDADAVEGDAGAGAPGGGHAAAAPASAPQEIALRDAASLPPLLMRLSERRPEPLDWLGVSYGLTPALFRFWKKNGYTPLYIRQVPNELTGEYSTVQLRTVSGAPSAWLAAFAADFCRRFTALLSFRFRDLSTPTALAVLEAAGRAAGADTPPLSPVELRALVTPFDVKRLESYGNNLVELQIVMDLLPTVATLHFGGRLRAVSDGDGAHTFSISAVSAALLLAVGLQRRTLDEGAAELQLPVSQAHTLLSKGVRRIVQAMRALERHDIERQLDATGARATAERGAASDASRPAFAPLTESLENELAAAGAGAGAGTGAYADAAAVSDAGAAAEETAADETAAEETPAKETAAAHAVLREDLEKDAEMSKYVIPGESDAAAGAPDWAEAEARVRKMHTRPDAKAYSSTFSVRTGRDAPAGADRAPKRKEARKGAGGARGKKKARAA